MPKGERLKEVHALAQKIWKQGRESYVQAVKRAWAQILDAEGAKKKTANAKD
jgi:hypothetical protein